jgi:hypothetical protein
MDLTIGEMWMVNKDITFEDCGWTNINKNEESQKYVLSTFKFMTNVTLSHRPAYMATKKATESLYHLSPKGFWKKFRVYQYVLPFTVLNIISGDVVSANPAISSGLPIPNENRDPPPASRPETYSTPATKCLYMPFLHNPFDSSIRFL